MPRRDGPIAVLMDGSLPSMVACLLAPDPLLVRPWFVPVGADLVDGPCTADGAGLARRQADLLTLGPPVPAAQGIVAATGATGSPALDADLARWRRDSLLLSALGDARRAGCARLVWPLVAGDDLDLLAATCERAHLLMRLASLDLGPRDDAAPEIDLALADLSRWQVRDLADDLDAPVEHALPYDADEPGSPVATLDPGATRHRALRA